MKLSVVIPVFDEVENLGPLDEAIRQALRGHDYEVILVDDGSTDGSLQRLEALAAADPAHLVVVELRRNFGQTAAMRPASTTPPAT